MADLYVSAAEITAFASEIRGMNAQVQSIFQALCSRMQQVNAVWQSPAANTLMDQFQTLRPSFDAYVSLINSYIQYLDQTAQAYEQNEAALSGSFSGA